MSKKLSPSLRLALIYLGFSVVWILLSDRVVSIIARNDVAVISELQTAKGIIFVLLSSVLLLVSSLHIYRSLQTTLQKKEELLDKLNALSEAAKEGIIDYDPLTDTAEINDEMKSILGIDTSVVGNFSAVHQDHIYEADRDRVNEFWKKFIESDHNLLQCEYRYGANGTFRDIVSRGYAIRDKKTGRALKIIYALQDVTAIRTTQKKYYEQQVQFSQSLSKTMIEAEEKEKSRWALELHDNVCQVLTVAKLYADEALRNSENPYVQKSKAMIEKALDDIRHISSSIRPPEFNTTTLYESITGLLENIKRLVSFEFQIEYDRRTEELLTTGQKLMVYRIIQEQLNNITKYSGATLVNIEIAINENSVITIVVKDNGRGFDPSKVKTGIGLKNIGSRLQLYSGELKIASSPGSGCELRAQFSFV
ncbi:MAG: PAS domain-containing sensor histidine kinase [Flavisolibacter sp.]